MAETKLQRELTNATAEMEIVMPTHYHPPCVLCTERQEGPFLSDEGQAAIEAIGQEQEGGRS